MVKTKSTVRSLSFKCGAFNRLGRGLAGVVVATGLVGGVFGVACLSGCQTGVTAAGLVKSGQVPAGASPVAQSTSLEQPLMYAATEPGRLYFVTNGKTAASFPLKVDDLVTLNEFEPMLPPGTQIEVNREVVYEANGRAGDNRFFFMPGPIGQ